MSGDLRERIAGEIRLALRQTESAMDLAAVVTALVQAELARAWNEGWNASADYMHVDYTGPDDPPNPYAAAPPAEGRSETHEFVKRIADLRCGRVDCNRHADDPVHQVPAAAADCNCGLSEIAPCPAHPPAEPGAPFPHRGLFELRKASDEVAATDPAVAAAARSYDEMVERIRAERRPTVVRTRRLLDRSGLGASTTGRMGFHREDPDNADNDTYMTVSWGTWGALGMPDQVTVTIEPGDLLNAAGPAAETPLLCSNCGKPMAEHDAMASCWTAKPHAQNPVTPMVVGADDRTPAAPLDVPHPFRPLWGDPESCGVARPDGSTCLFVADADIHRTSAADGTTGTTPPPAAPCCECPCSMPVAGGTCLRCGQTVQPAAGGTTPTAEPAAERHEYENSNVADMCGHLTRTSVNTGYFCGQPADHPVHQPAAVPRRLCCGKQHLGVTCPDGLVMCCLCFDRFNVADLRTLPGGQRENVCLTCATNEARHQPATSSGDTEPAAGCAFHPQMYDDLKCAICGYERGLHRPTSSGQTAEPVMARYGEVMDANGPGAEPAHSSGQTAEHGIDTAAIRNRLFWADGKPSEAAGDAITALCDALDRQREEIARLRAELAAQPPVNLTQDLLDAIEREARRD